MQIRLLPNLEKLDSQEVTPLERQQAARNPELDKYLSLSPEAATPRPASRPQPASPQSAQGDRQPAASPPGQRNKNILYAVMVSQGACWSTCLASMVQED